MLALHRAGLEAHQPICRTLDALNKDPAPTPKRALLRQASEVGAQCGNSARWDLCGGPPARAVPTATDRRKNGRVSGPTESSDA